MFKFINRNVLLVLSPSSSMFMANCRSLCTAPKTRRGSHKIRNHFVKSGQLSNLNLFPEDLQRITSKKQSQIYVASKGASDQIANLIGQFHEKTVPFVELLPGPCILSEALLKQLDMSTLLLVEKDKQFVDIQQVPYRDTVLQISQIFC